LFFGGGKIFGFDKSLPRYNGFSICSNPSNKDSQGGLYTCRALPRSLYAQLLHHKVYLGFLGPTQPNSDATDPLPRWEKGVLELLKSTQDQKMIRKICRLPFRDRNTLQDVLSRRWNSELDRHLMSLRVEVRDHQEEIFDWPRDRKAEDFLRQVLRTSRKPLPVWDWAWNVLDSVTGSRSPSQIADTVSDVINTAVLRVDFREWAGCAFGYDEHGVTSCLNGVEHARNLLRQQLQKLDQLKTKCESVEKVSSIQNLFW
jgi:hypothetical protein